MRKHEFTNADRWANYCWCGGQWIGDYCMNEKKDVHIDPNQSKKGKLPLGESMWVLEHTARVSEQAKAKGYEHMNWIKSDTKCYFVSYLCSAALRHINKFVAGDDYNIEYKNNEEVKHDFDVLHLESAAYNLLMAAHLFRMGRTDLDDRKKKELTFKPGEFQVSESSIPISEHVCKFDITGKTYEDGVTKPNGRMYCECGASWPKEEHKP